MRTRHLLSAVAVTAAVAAGGIAGALIGIPGVSGAQESTTTIPDATTPDSDAPLRERPFRGGHHGPGFLGGPGKLDAAATALGLTLEELREKLADGTTSLADIAEELGIDAQKVIDAMVAEANEHFDDAVAAGRLTEEQATDLKANVSERITAFVNEPFANRKFGPGGFGPRGHHGPGPQLDVAAEALGMTTADLLTELRAGKSIAEVAEEKGVDVDKVIDALVAEAKTRITDMVNNKFKAPDED